MVEGSPRKVAVAAHDGHMKTSPSGDDEDKAHFKFRHDLKPSSPGRSNPAGGRWKKLRTTVQLTQAVTHRSKPPLKREDSFLKRFSTRPPSAGQPSSPQHPEAPASDKWQLRRAVLNPDESLLFWWLWLVTACGLYNAWTLIAREAFPELDDRCGWLWSALDWFTDIVYLLDVAVQFRTGYLEQGIMVRDGRRLARHYLRSRDFFLDVAALAPLGLFKGFIGDSPLLRFPRFLKARRIYKFYYAVESRTAYPNLWRVANLIHVLLLLAHWFGCFYYMLSELEGFVGGWAYQHPPGGEEKSPLVRKYLGSVYWSTLTLTTIGDLATPATNLQYLFTIISYLIGVFIFATIVGQVGNVITNRNASRLEFERLLDGAKMYMRHHKVPKGMQRRVQRWYDYSWSRGRMQGGGDIHSALGILPDKLKTELAIHVNLKTLKKVSIFQECQPEFLHDLVLKMKAYIFTPGDLVCRKGEVAREMFIIADGILQVINEKGQVLTHMQAGDFFGEIGILNLDGFNRRTADVRSVGYSELFSLSREDVLSAMKDYPEAEEILQTMGRRRLLEARLNNASEKLAHQADSELKNENKQRKLGLNLTHLLRKKDPQQFDSSNHKQKHSNTTIISNKPSNANHYPEVQKKELHQNSVIHFNHVELKPSDTKISTEESARVTCFMEQITSKFRKRRKTPQVRTRLKHSWWYKISNFVHLRRTTFSTSSKCSDKLHSDEDLPVVFLRNDELKLRKDPSIDNRKLSNWQKDVGEDKKLRNKQKESSNDDHSMSNGQKDIVGDGRTGNKQKENGEGRRTNCLPKDATNNRRASNWQKDSSSDDRKMSNWQKDSSSEDRKMSNWHPSKPSVSNWNRSELFGTADTTHNRSRRKTFAEGMLFSVGHAPERLVSTHVSVVSPTTDVQTHETTEDVSPMSSNYSLTPSTTESEESGENREDVDIETKKMKVYSPNLKVTAVQSSYQETELPEEFRLMIRNIVFGIKDKVDALIVQSEYKTIEEIKQLRERIKQQDALIEYLESRCAKQANPDVHTPDDIVPHTPSSPVARSSTPDDQTQEEADIGSEAPSPADLLKFEEEEMWLVEFPPNLPAPAKPRSKLRRHSSVEVGPLPPFHLSLPTHEADFFLQPQPPMDGQVSPRRFSESHVRPDVVRLNSSFAAKVRRVLAKVRVNRESEEQSGGEETRASRWPHVHSKREEKRGRRSSTGSTNDRLQSGGGLFQTLQPKKYQGSSSEPSDSNTARYSGDTKPGPAKRLLPTITESNSFDSLRESPFHVQTPSPLATTDSEIPMTSVVIDMTTVGEDFP
ncbi:hypothetical protein JTE90_001266 [Oedothorax gibbosus]|uniref:Cyclic nucleotide-binding domain-containing protein n=1 Tax=Oedothorax gibbosus TaxID=931172 RepID=A0AAV6V2Q4_9ARAC|nr:hypothetical protein JTE90_001266 [Oedothorax gibbosus]